jgi:hypothetical protein
MIIRRLIYPDSLKLRRYRWQQVVLDVNSTGSKSKFPAGFRGSEPQTLFTQTLSAHEYSTIGPSRDYGFSAADNPPGQVLELKKLKDV